MSVAPEPYLSACLEVIHRAVLEARFMAWTGELSNQKLADLMDAIHNIPHLLNDWERCDEQRLRESLLAFDNETAGEDGVHLGKIYVSVIDKYDENR